ncbi:DUF423 domain-containing protein [Chryseotalea sanaruensis]|jgi:uncharacterized membrane protein YgdD (TMEM256/DUF423 family)|uniref:DUF423 domain-containing protein n=1 Tax=Chryseotalea sanaruensis TaxID=2482724 RepID=A0A401U9G5_9BACT|nr:DUF423 domain-containing protein [Chryseotalea sanaruensis]GCC51520.1 DUF423 domain-containing protein [Chryseotalea sanaruensis]
MTSKHILIVAAASGMLCVALGAFGAHALKETLSEYGRVDTFELAVRYQFFHTLALLFLGLDTDRKHSLSASLFISGILLFSGSLYFLALTNSTTLVLVTPVGGTLLIAGWASLLWHFIKRA